MIIDLTMTLSEDTEVFPGDVHPCFERRDKFEDKGFNRSVMTVSTHTGTHIDVPCHLVPDANNKTITDYNPEKFFGECVVLDVRGRDEISLTSEEKEKIKDVDFVFFHTGHLEKMGSDDYFKNNPVLTKECGHDLLDAGISIVGLDSFSPDRYPFEVHKMLLPEDILILENLDNLVEVQGKMKCIIAPMKIKGADGAPCRVFCY